MLQEGFFGNAEGKEVAFRQVNGRQLVLLFTVIVAASGTVVSDGGVALVTKVVDIPQDALAAHLILFGHGAAVGKHAGRHAFPYFLIDEDQAQER